MHVKHERCDDAGHPSGCRAARFDRAGAPLDRTIRGRRVRAVVARVGVLEYPELGTNELVTADALRRTDSLVGRPVVVGHPPPDARGSKFVRADTVIVGHVVSARFDATTGEVHAELEITDSSVLGEVAAGDLSEVSPGYAAATAPSPGTWQGQRYDTVQTDRKYDHVALLPPGHGRCGAVCSCRVDSTKNVRERTDMSTQTEEFLRRWEARLDEREKRLDEAEKKFEEERKDAEAKAAEEAEKTDADKAALEAERDVLKAKLAELEAKLAEVGSDEAMDARADARAALIDKARRVLGRDTKLERTDDKSGKARRMTDREIKLAVLAKIAPDVDPAKVTDAYIDARFDAHMAMLANAPSDALSSARANAFGPPPATRADGHSELVNEHTVGREPPPSLGDAWRRG